MDCRQVSAADLELLLAGLQKSIANDNEGIFGPGSVSWQINREAALFLAAGRAALLQLAHPWVAAAIAQHSRTLNNPIDRFHQTFRVIFTMVFGPAEQAFTAARQLHRLHQQIYGVLPHTAGRFREGTAYEANEIGALAWVNATLIDSALVAYEILLPPLSQAQREQYFTESVRMAALFGIPPDCLPADYCAFREYFEATVQSDALAVTAATREFARKLQSGAGLRLPPPFWYQALTIQLLPPRIREQFQLDYSERERRSVRRALSWLRPVYRTLPDALRFVGPYNEARYRLRGTAPGLAVRLSNRLWIGQPTLLALPRS